MALTRNAWFCRIQTFGVLPQRELHATTAPELSGGYELVRAAGLDGWVGIRTHRRRDAVDKRQEHWCERRVDQRVRPLRKERIHRVDGGRNVLPPTS
eukprot:1753543-Prymnesium_polylepis.1